jgi:hypothetical protein
VSEQEDKSGWTGDRARYADAQRAYEAAVNEADANAKAVAFAVRAGLAEIAVEISSIRGFGVAQAKK